MLAKKDFRPNLPPDGNAEGTMLGPDQERWLLDGLRTAKLRQERESLPGIGVTGSGNSRAFAAGHRFTLADHVNADGEYVLTRVEHEAATEGGRYRNDDAARTEASRIGLDENRAAIVTNRPHRRIELDRPAQHIGHPQRDELRSTAEPRPAPGTISASRAVTASSI